MTPAFHFNILQQFLTIFNEETAKMVSRFEEVADKEPVNIVPFVTQMTLQSIGGKFVKLFVVTPTSK